MAKILLVFALFIWFRISWLSAGWLTSRLFSRWIARAGMDVKLSAFGVARNAGIHMYLVPPLFVALLFFSLLWLGAYFVVNCLSLTL